MILRKGMWKGRVNKRFSPTLVYFRFDVRKFNNIKKAFAPLFYDPKHTHVRPSYLHHFARNDFYRAKQKKIQLKFLSGYSRIYIEKGRHREEKFKSRFAMKN